METLPSPRVLVNGIVQFVEAAGAGPERVHMLAGVPRASAARAFKPACSGAAHGFGASARPKGVRPPGSESSRAVRCSCSDRPPALSAAGSPRSRPRLPALSSWPHRRPGTAPASRKALPQSRPTHGKVFRGLRRAAAGEPLEACVLPTSGPGHRAALREPLRPPCGFLCGSRSLTAQAGWFSLFAHRHLLVMSHSFIAWRIVPCADDRRIGDSQLDTATNSFEQKILGRVRQHYACSRPNFAASACATTVSCCVVRRFGSERMMRAASCAVVVSAGKVYACRGSHEAALAAVEKLSVRNFLPQPFPHGAAAPFSLAKSHANHLRIHATTRNRLSCPKWA